MRVPVSWLRSLVPGLTAGADELAAALVRAGLEVEQVHRVGHDVAGVVTGRVLDVEELAGFTKRIRFCHVALSEGDRGEPTHEVVCGATNFEAGDRVAFAVPGAQLPGGVLISARKTYGRTSDGMICSAAELGLSGDSDGILVLAPDVPLGVDVVELLELRDEVLDIAVTPDRGYQLSVRGVAREAATAFGLVLADPADVAVPESSPGGVEVRLADPDGCDLYLARSIYGLDPAATSPTWLQRRLVLAGMRPISLAVDITNYVMVGLGQPLHAFDADALTGAITVRRARPDERLTTLDGQDRALLQTDLLITDESGPIALAGVMGGGPTEITADTTSIVLEAAHFGATSIARTARHHRLPSEASRRYERGVDPALCRTAAEIAVRLMVELGGATAGPVTQAGEVAQLAPVTLDLDLPGRLAGRPYAPTVVAGRLREVGCTVSDAAGRAAAASGAAASDGSPARGVTGAAGAVVVLAPTWRPDLTRPADLVEEVWRLEGYDTIPVELPVAPAGRGLTAEQRLRRLASRTLAAQGLVEVVTPPFVSDEALEVLGGGMPAPRLLNPLSDRESLLRPALLPGLLATAGRNVGRGMPDVALFETGAVFAGPGTGAPTPSALGPPTAAERAALDAALPPQPRHAAVVLTGRRAGWALAVSALVELGSALGLTLQPAAASDQPYHPGRCAELRWNGGRVGLAGELHPRVVAALDLPPGTCAGELDLDVLVGAAAARPVTQASVISHFPPAAVDVALVVDAGTSAASVEEALRQGAGPLLEELRLFDVYTGPQLGEGRRSLAYALRLRAADRTLTDVEVRAARDDAIAEAGRRTGAELRS